MNIGFITDEICSDVNEAIEIGVSWGIRDFELRVIGKNRVPHICDTDIQQIITLQNKHKIKITALSPGTFKGTLQNIINIQKEVNEVLPKTFQLAKLFNCKLIIVFGIQRSEKDHPEDEKKVISIFRQISQMAQNEGITIAVENEPGFWCHDGSGTANILRKVNSPFLMANWDPANAVGTSEIPFPSGYEALKHWIVNVHIKDTIEGALIECVPVGEGVVNWQGQIDALLRDKIVEHITIETHCLPLIERSKQNLDIVRKWLKCNKSKSSSLNNKNGNRI